MMIYLISGDGPGAGKTTLANTLVGVSNVWSLAGLARAELQRFYPGYDWFSKDQQYKDTTRVREAGDRTIREILIDHAETVCLRDPEYYARKLVDKLRLSNPVVFGTTRLAVDDVRKVVELDFLRSNLPCTRHLHVQYSGSPHEGYDSKTLATYADYCVVRK